VADNYRILRQRQTVESLGGGEVRDVVEVTVETKPSNVIYPLRVPVLTATAENIAMLASTTAAVIEQDLQHPNVQTITLDRELDAAGLLQLMAQVYVASNDGQGQGVVEIIAPHLNEPEFSAAIQPEIDRLNAIQAL
jgi:hypothetical protein